MRGRRRFGRPLVCLQPLLVTPLGESCTEDILVVAALTLGRHQHHHYYHCGHWHHLHHQYYYYHPSITIVIIIIIYIFIIIFFSSSSNNNNNMEVVFIKVSLLPLHYISPTPPEKIALTFSIRDLI